VSCARFLLLVIWLSVPLAGLIMLRQDRHRFYETSRLQRADCLARADVLRRYTLDIHSRAVTIDSIIDPQTRQRWQRQWRDLLEQMRREKQLLRQTAPTHYPRTDAKLLELEQLLTQQQQGIEDAALMRDMYIKSTSGIYDLAQEIAQVRGFAEYYRRLGSQSIYLVFMDDLAMLEEEYQRREDEMNRLAGEVHNAQIQAQLNNLQLIEQLDDLSKLMTEDESLTYEEELAQRFRTFSLREELRKLLTGSAPA
jgi:hypothetical protein